MRFPMLARWAPRVYVQLAPQLLTLRHVQSGRRLSEPPLVALSPASPRRKVLSIGADAPLAVASEPGAQLLNPFAHPRSLLSDFTLADVVLKHCLRKLLPSGGFRPAPWIVLHPPNDVAGGYTQIEVRSLHELAHGAGASRVFVWQGRALEDGELLSGQFPPHGELLA